MCVLVAGPAGRQTDRVGEADRRSGLTRSCSGVTALGSVLCCVFRICVSFFRVPLWAGEQEVARPARGLPPSCMCPAVSVPPLPPAACGVLIGQRKCQSRLLSSLCVRGRGSSCRNVNVSVKWRLPSRLRQKDEGFGGFFETGRAQDSPGVTHSGPVPSPNAPPPHLPETHPRLISRSPALAWSARRRELSDE